MIPFPLDNTEYEAVALGAWCGTRTRGVFSADNHYKVTASGGMTITTDPGLAWLKADEYWGISAYEPNARVFTLDTADGSLTRYDSVAVQLDKNLNVCDVVIKKGAYATNPPLSSVPFPVHNLDYDEIIPFAVRIRAGATEILETDIFDLRMDENYCGIMRDGVTGIPTQTLYDMWMAWFTEFQGVTQDAFANYQQMAADLYTQYLAEIAVHENNAQAAYDAYVGRMGTFESTAQADFEAWVATLKDILDEEVAGHLQLEIEALQQRVPSSEIGTVQIPATMPLYPRCALYVSEWAFGIGGAGIGPAGGGSVSTVGADITFDEHTVTVSAPPQYGEFTEMIKLSDTEFAFLKDSGTQSLVLQIKN